MGGTVNFCIEFFFGQQFFRIFRIVCFVRHINIIEDSAQLVVIGIGKTEFQFGAAEDQLFQFRLFIIADGRDSDGDQLAAGGRDFAFQIVLGFQTFPDRFDGVVTEFFKIFFRIFADRSQFQHEFCTTVQVDPQMQGTGRTLADHGDHVGIGFDFAVFDYIFRQELLEFHAALVVCGSVDRLGGIRIFLDVGFLFCLCIIDQGNEFRIIGILGDGAEGVVKIRLGHGEHAPDKDRHHRYSEEGSEEEGSFHFWAASMVVVAGTMEPIAALPISMFVLGAIVITNTSSFTSKIVPWIPPTVTTLSPFLMEVIIS